MSLFGRLKNIFTSNSASNNDTKKRQKHSLIKFDVDPNELWEIVGELGDGAFGKVYKARHKVQQIFAALKQVDINDETELDDYSVEIDILHQCQHKNIVGLHEAFFFGGKLWMFIEFCGGGALDGIMLELEKPLTEPQIRYVCREMCEALDFLHQHFVIHRDLKAGNVLLTCEGEVKLADFGVSARNSSYRQKRDTFIGTPYWMAPEVILCETIKDSPYDFKADIWSFGITLIEFAQIEPPNNEMHPMRVLVKIQKSDPPSLNYPSRWSKDFNDFVAKCLSRDPDQRPTAGDLLQHPFIRDVKDNQSIMELVSEANAEIILEEKDLDDDMDEGIDLDSRSGATTDVDSDSVSTASGSNILKPNGAEEDNVSDTSPTTGDTGKVLLPAIVVSGGGETVPKSQSSKEPAKQPVAAAATDDEKRLKAAEPPQQGAVTADQPPEGEEPVILRKKKPPPAAAEVDKTPSPEESTDGPTGQKKYRTLTKTRKYMINGEVVMSKVSKIIVPGSATDKKQQEHQLWKADLRELKLLHKQEKNLLHDMELKSLAAIDEQTRKFEQDNALLLRNAEYSLDQMSKQHKQQMDRMTMNHASEMKNVQKKTRQEQDKDLKSFNESLKQELKLLKQEVDLMPKEVRKDTFQQRKREKEIEHAEKERKFIEQQKESMVRALKRVEDQQKDQVALAERQFLQLKQQTIGAREVSLWEADVSQLRDRNRLNVQQLDCKFMLKKQLMMTRHAKEMEQVQRINASKEEELLQCHLLENKRLPKIMKNEGKTRTLMFKQSLRISVMGITADQEKEKIKQFEETEKRRLKEEETRLRKKHKRQMDELRARNDAVVKELEQVHAEKRKMLEDNEAQKRKELEDQFETDLNNMQLGQIPKKEALEAAFVQEMADNERFYANGSSVDQDAGKGSRSGASQITLPSISQVPAATKPPAKVSPGGGKKLPASEAPKQLTQPDQTSSRASAERGPVPVTKVSEEKLHTSAAKLSVEKVPVTTAKDAEQKLPTPVTKIAESTIPAPSVKVPEEKLPALNAKVSVENVPVLVTKAPEERIPAPTATVPEEKSPVSVAKVSVEKVPILVPNVPEATIDIPATEVPEETIPVPSAKVSVETEKVPVPIASVWCVPEETMPVPTVNVVSEEKLPVSVDVSSVLIGDRVDGDLSSGGHHVGLSAVAAVREVPQEENRKSDLPTAIPVFPSVEEKVFSGAAVSAIGIPPTDDGAAIEASEPIVPSAPAAADALPLISLLQQLEIPPLTPPQSSNEQSSNAHSTGGVEFLQTEAVVTAALPVYQVSSHVEDHAEKAVQPCGKLESREESLLSHESDSRVAASSVALEEETSGKVLPIVSTSTAKLSSTSTESSAEKYVSGSHGKDEKSDVEEKSAVLECQTEVSPSWSSDLAHAAAINAEPDFEIPATDVTDEGRSHSHSGADLDETAETKVSHDVKDSHHATIDSNLHETDDSNVETHHVVLESSVHPHHESKDTALEDTCSHPEKSDMDSDPHQKEKSSAQEKRIETHLESSESAKGDNLEKSDEAFEQVGTVHHEKTGHEANGSGDGKKDSFDDIISCSHDHPPGESEPLIEFEKPDQQVIDVSHKDDDGHHDKGSETQVENSADAKTGDIDDSLIDLSSADENLDASREHTDPQHKPDESSSDQQKDDRNLHKCSESGSEKDDGLPDTADTSSSSCGSVTLPVEVAGASDEKESSPHQKNESSNEKNDQHPEDAITASPDKKEPSVVAEEES